MAEKTKIAKFSDVYEDERSEGFYDEYEYVDIRDLKDKVIIIEDLTAFESEKGPGVAVLFELDGADYKTVTHSIGVTKALTSAAILDTVKAGTKIEVAIRRKKSDKTGRDYFYLE